MKTFAIQIKFTGSDSSDNVYVCDLRNGLTPDTSTNLHMARIDTREVTLSIAGSIARDFAAAMSEKKPRITFTYDVIRYIKSILAKYKERGIDVKATLEIVEVVALPTPAQVIEL